MEALVAKFDLEVKFVKKRVNVWTKYNELESLMLHTKCRQNRPLLVLFFPIEKPKLQNLTLL